MSEFLSRFNPDMLRRTEARYVPISEFGISSEAHNHPIQDTSFLIPELGTAGIEDGISTANGYEGSKEGAGHFTTFLKYNANKPLNLRGRASQLVNTFLRVDQELQGVGGTTATVTQLLEMKNGKKKLLLGSIGDSRAYRKSGSRQIEQLTTDDNIIKGVFGNTKEGRRLEEKLDTVTRFDQLATKELWLPRPTLLYNPETKKYQTVSTTTEQQLYYNLHSLTQSLGSFGLENFEEKYGFAPAHIPRNVEIKVLTVKSGDMIIFTTDGVHKVLTKGKMNDIAQNNQDPQHLADALVTEASRDRSFRQQADDRYALAFKVP